MSFKIVTEESTHIEASPYDYGIADPRINVVDVTIREKFLEYNIFGFSGRFRFSYKVLDVSEEYDLDNPKVNIAEPVMGSQIGKREILIHPPSECKGFFCPFHNPSNHPMKDWEINVRLDRSALVERLCPICGCGHPDSDSLAYFERKGVKYMGVHGCCPHNRCGIVEYVTY
jgi:hypothetical protein